MYRYRFKTVCAATCTETWTVTSPVPLSDEEARAIMVDGGDEERGIELSCIDEEVSDEENRTIIAGPELL